MTDKLDNTQYAHILNGYTFEFFSSDKDSKLKFLGLYNSGDGIFYETNDLTICFCLAFFAKRNEKLLPKISEDWWALVEEHFELPIFSKNLPETDQFKAFVKGVEIPKKNEDWFPAKIHLLTSKGTYFPMDICTVLNRMRDLTLSKEAVLPPIFSDELSEDDWWHKAMGCHYHDCPYGSHCC